MSCTHKNAVYWNPYNKAIQCHRCGQMFSGDKKMEEYYEGLYGKVCREVNEK